MTTIIQTNGLTKKYRRLIALDNVNPYVQGGALYALVGQNAAGKTTAIKILMNLIPAARGTGQVLGTNSRKIRGKTYTHIGYVYENQEIPERMKVGALLDYLRPFYPTWDSALEQSLVKQLDLPLDRKIKALARGMKTKLALASALAFHPKLIVLDEPLRRSRSSRSRSTHRRPARVRFRIHRLHLLSRSCRNRKLRQPCRLSRIRQVPTPDRGLGATTSWDLRSLL
ncbi:MAG: ABC transporter ATP-binding protein [Candidatus Acidiferrum sp.]